MAHTILALDVLNANNGDALLLLYGLASHPRTILIDGGPAGMYEEVLKDHLKTRCSSTGPPRTLDAVVITHIDSDHIAGIKEMLDATRRMWEENSEKEDCFLHIRQVWANVFDDSRFQIGKENASLACIVSAAGPPAGLESLSFLVVPESVLEARAVRDMVNELSIGGGGCRPTGAGDTFDMNEGLHLDVLCPTQRRLDRLRAEWGKKVSQTGILEAASEGEKSKTDRSETNLSSIVLHARVGDKNRGCSMLLTGDALDRDIIEALTQGRDSIPPSGRSRDLPIWKFDVLKVPHHGSSRNCRYLFNRVIADHYVFSGTGENNRNNNPEPETLKMLAEGRREIAKSEKRIAAGKYSVYFTNKEDRLEEAYKELGLSGAVVRWLIDQKHFFEFCFDGNNLVVNERAIGEGGI